MLALRCAGAGRGRAADYPTRPIRLLVPFAPGGGADTLARIITPKLTEAMGQQWVVDNRGGAAGNIAAETVARAAPDGYTVFMGFSTVLTVNPSLYKLDFDVEKDLQPVTLLATAQYILVLHPGVQAESVKELVALLKQKPSSLNYASAGVGSPLHLAGELFQRRAGRADDAHPLQGRRSRGGRGARRRSAAHLRQRRLVDAAREGGQAESARDHRAASAPKSRPSCRRWPSRVSRAST